MALLAFLVATLHAYMQAGMRSVGEELKLQSVDFGGKREQARLPQKAIERFEKDGFVIVRGLLPRETVEILYENRPRTMFAWLGPFGKVIEWLTASKISIDAIWSENALFRSLWFRGPVPRVASSLMGNRPVRLLTDIVYGIPRGTRPKYLGLWHKDSTSFDIVERDTAMGLSAWIPLIDIDSEEFGGSIYLGNISVVSVECQQEPDDDCSEECVKHLDKVGTAHSYKRGDVLFFTDHTFHRSQPLKANAMKDDRFSLVGRFVQGDSIYAASGVTSDKQRKNYCKHNLKAGDKITSNCFPQVYPPVELPDLSHLFPSVGEHFLGNLKSVLGFS